VAPEAQANDYVDALLAKTKADKAKNDAERKSTQKWNAIRFGRDQQAIFMKDPAAKPTEFGVSGQLTVKEKVAMDSKLVADIKAKR